MANEILQHRLSYEQAHVYRAGTTHSDETIIGIFTGAVDDCPSCAAVDSIYYLDLLGFIRRVVLIDAVLVNPEVAILSGQCDVDCVLDDLQEG